MHVNRIARARRSSGNIDFRVPGRVTDVAIRIGRRGGTSDVTVGQSARRELRTRLDSRDGDASSIERDGDIVPDSVPTARPA